MATQGENSCHVLVWKVLLSSVEHKIKMLLLYYHINWCGINFFVFVFCPPRPIKKTKSLISLNISYIIDTGCLY